MKKISHEIESVQDGSVASRAGLVKGDIISKINNVELEDIFDYHYFSYDSRLLIEVIHSNNETEIVEINKEPEEDLGIIFCNGLMDDYKSCRNKCVFCFIDQMPPGMRPTLYFKDDDTRLSFLQGNYVTLTNMSMEDLDRIIKYNLGPINISVHATNKELRMKLLNNRFAGDILEKIKKLYDAGIPMNAQVVACPGLNDGVELEKTISDLLEFAPTMQSMSVVPVGLTKFREGLYPLRTYTCKEAAEVIDIIEKWQKIAFDKYGIHFVQASDEWYILAKRELPKSEQYDGFIQLENGVGMIRLLEDEIDVALNNMRKQLFMKKRHVSIPCGKLIAPYLEIFSKKIEKKFPKISVDIYPIQNNFFGENITVTGLITGKDLIEQLKGHDLGDCLLLSSSMLRSSEEVFLDDVTLDEVSSALQVKTRIVQSDGLDFVNSIIGK